MFDLVAPGSHLTCTDLPAAAAAQRVQTADTQPLWKLVDLAHFQGALYAELGSGLQSISRSRRIGCGERYVQKCCGCCGRSTMPTI